MYKTQNISNHSKNYWYLTNSSTMFVNLLMPDRYIEDKTTQCIPVTKTRYVPTIVSTTAIAYSATAVLGSLHPTTGTTTGTVGTTIGNGTTSVKFTEAPRDASAALTTQIGTSVQISGMTTGKNIVLQSQVTNQNSESTVTVTLTQTANIEGQPDIVLYNKDITFTEDLNIDILAQNNNDIILSYKQLRQGSGALGFTNNFTRYVNIDQVQTNYVVIECNNDGKFDADYRFGFNGQMKDNEIAGIGNSLDYKERTYDSRLGKFLSIDPLTKSFPWYTPYQFAGNKPIQFVDLDGKEECISSFYYTAKSGSNFMKISDANLVCDASKKRNEIINIFINNKSYIANSYQTLMGRDDRYNSNGDFTGIKDLSNKDLSAILGYADFVFNIYGMKDPKEMTVMSQSNAGPLKTQDNLLDFKTSLYNIFNFDKQSLIAIDGVAYNANEAGNYIWAMCLIRNGIILSPNLIAEAGTKGRHDEENEQKAITAGVKKANSIKIDQASFNFGFQRTYYDYQNFIENNSDTKKYVPNPELKDNYDLQDY